MALPGMMANKQQTQPPMSAPQPQGGGSVAAVPFVRAALKGRFASTSQSTALGASVASQSHVIPAIGGWNRWIELVVQCVTAGNAAAVTFAADGPFNVFTQITLKDAGQKAIYQLRGYDTYLMERYGGYHLYQLDALTRSYVATTGAVATGGSFSYSIWIPQELGREGIGSYPNMDASQRLTIDLAINANANIYGVPPTAAGTLTVTPIVHYYVRPGEMDYDGRPQETVPAGAGTMQYWRELTAVLPSGAFIQTFNLSGRYIRNAFALFTDASDVRSDTVLPSSLRVELDNALVYDAPRFTYDAYTAKMFGVDNVTGLVPLLLGTTDPDRVPGAEWADDWWKTATSSQLVIKGSTGAAGKLWLILNEVEPVGNVFR